jgi:hypothetical protein
MKSPVTSLVGRVAVSNTYGVKESIIERFMTGPIVGSSLKIPVFCHRDSLPGISISVHGYRCGLSHDRETTSPDANCGTERTLRFLHLSPQRTGQDEMFTRLFAAAYSSSRVAGVSKLVMQTLLVEPTYQKLLDKMAACWRRKVTGHIIAWESVPGKSDKTSQPIFPAIDTNLPGQIWTPFFTTDGVSSL